MVNIVTSAAPVVGVTAMLPEEGGEFTVTRTSEKPFKGEEDEEEEEDSVDASSRNL
jgi:hypothetical protein